MIFKVEIFKFWGSTKDQAQEIRDWANNNIFDWDSQVKSITQSSAGNSVEGTMTILTIIWKV